MLVSLLALSFSAQAGDNKPDIKVSGILYAHYMYNLDEAAANANSFDLDRAYLTVGADLTDHLATKLTLDADREKDSLDSGGDAVFADTKTRLFVKNAWLEWRKITPGVKARFGIVDTGFVPFVDGFTGFRYVGKDVADEMKIMSTADFGLNVQGEHAKGLVNWHVAFINGEGYSKPEVDSGKTVTARIGVDPLASGEKMSLPVLGYVGYAFPPENGTAVLTYAGGAGFKQKYVLGWGEYVGTSAGTTGTSAYSALISPRMPKIGAIIVKYDHFDPDSDASATDDSITKVVAGVSHDFFERVSLAGTYERAWLDGAEDTPWHAAVLHMQAGF